MSDKPNHTFAVARKLFRNYKKNKTKKTSAFLGFKNRCKYEIHIQLFDFES